MPQPHMLPCEELGQLYQAGFSTSDLAKRYDCSPTTVAKRLRACGITLRRSRFLAAPVAEAELRRLYLEERLPIAQIAAHFAVSASTIGNKRRQFGIPTRPRQV